MSDEPCYTVGSGNVFADLGVPEPDIALAKAQLAHQIETIIDERGLTQHEAAEILGIGQPKVSALVRGRLRDFSTERLMHLLTRFDVDIDITMRPKEPAQITGRISVSNTVTPRAASRTSRKKTAGAQAS